MKRHQQPPPHEDERLQDIAYCIDTGLRKLVPTTHYGAPGYTKYGVANSQRHPEYNEDVQEHLVVLLAIWYIAIKQPDGKYRHQYQCVITIKDGDDFIYQRWREFTYENWCEQLDMYNSITEIDQHTMEYLTMEGFS